MDKLIVAIFFMLPIPCLYGQRNTQERAVVEEGKKLYKSEMASWYGTDIFLERFPEKREQIGGYFSYNDGDLVKCLFFSKTQSPDVLATISFDSTFSINNAKVDGKERDFTTLESDIYTIRREALALINSDTLFKTYSNTDLNLIPLVDGNSKKVFVLTGPKKTGVVIFGNDYLITFNKKNQVTNKKQLHKNIIPTEYSRDGKNGDIQVLGAMHTHLPETGSLITSTDICTLMLYEKFAGWKSYYVMSGEYVSIWDCEANTLAVLSREVFEKISKDQEERHKDKE